MIRILLSLAVFACIATSCGTSNISLQETDVNRAVSAVDATSAWNSVCFQYNFIPKPLDWNVTFAAGYYGSDFNADIVGITVAVNQLLDVNSPSTGDDRMDVNSPSTGDDRMRFDIENWGE